LFVFIRLFFFFFFKQKTAYEIRLSLVGSEMCIRDRRNSGRLAVLDGRMRRRGWGRTVLQALEPWVALTRLRPD